MASERLERVSVVIPTHNRARILRRTLATVRWQVAVELEVLVVDDGSTDGTAEVVTGLGDDRVRLIRHDVPQGVAMARNAGIAAATGDWVAFLDDDDLWAPDKLASQVRAARKLSREWAYGGCVVLEHDGSIVATTRPPPPERLVERLPFGNLVPAGASNVLASRRLLEEVGGFDPELRHTADWDLFIRLAHGGVPAAVDAPVLAYVLHRENATLDIKGAVAEASWIEQVYVDLRGGAPIDWAQQHRWTAWAMARSGDRLRAAQAYLRAARHGDRRSWARAVVILVHPHVGRRAVYRVGPDLAWAGPAQGWLERCGVTRPLAS